MVAMMEEEEGEAAETRRSVGVARPETDPIVDGEKEEEEEKEVTEVVERVGTADADFQSASLDVDVDVVRVELTGGATPAPRLVDCDDDAGRSVCWMLLELLRLLRLLRLLATLLADGSRL